VAREALGGYAAVRALAFQWIRILFRCWKNRVPYDESLYQSRFVARHTPRPLFGLLVEILCGLPPTSVENAASRIDRPAQISDAPMLDASDKLQLL
jgi:hypothetical protein